MSDERERLAEWCDKMARESDEVLERASASSLGERLGPRFGATVTVEKQAYLRIAALLRSSPRLTAEDVRDEDIDAALMVLESEGSEWLGTHTHQGDRRLVAEMLAHVFKKRASRNAKEQAR